MTRVRRFARALAASVRTIAPAYPSALVLATVPALATAAQGHHRFTGTVEAAAILGGAALGFAIDDPAAVTLQASPTTLIERRLAHVVPSLGLAMLMLGGVAWMTVMWSSEPIPVRFIAVEFFAAAAVSLAVAAAARTDAAVSTGLGATMAALLVLGVVSSLGARFRGLPMIAIDDFHERWRWIAIVGVVVAVWGSLDPGRRRWRRA